MEKGMDSKEAAISSAKELTIPLLISTLTTSAAFLAFFLAENTMGEMMGNIFIVITITLLSSWILALTIVAMLAVYFMRVKRENADLRRKSRLVSEEVRNLRSMPIKGR